MAGINVNLHSEATTQLKDGARSPGGKLLHPFFSSRKNKKSTDIIDISDEDSDYSRLHVYEKVEDEQSVLDWKKWMMYEKNILELNESLSSNGLCSSVFEGAVMALSFDGFTTIKNVDKADAGGLEACIEDDLQINDKWNAPFIQCPNQQKYSLWTAKYQPEKAFEVCGNNESVNFLSDWLHKWQEKLPQNEGIEEDSDLEDRLEGSYLKNVLLITGPVGSGKSAAIYACAKEQGFEVIEVSASHCRNGSNMQKFAEALESHTFKGLWQNYSMKTRSAKGMEVTSSQSHSIFIEEFDDDVHEIVSSLSSQSQETQLSFPIPKNGVKRKAANKALLFFEDVDIIFDDDRGFLAAVVKMAKTAKRPIILTSNRRDPSLPRSLDRLEVEFKLPSVEELLPNVSMVCVAEKAFTCRKLLRLFVKSFRADIRKTLLNLQFWLQGNHDKYVQISQSSCTALQFDINAWHWVLPTVLSFEFPSELAKAVEEEISLSDAIVKDLNLVNVPILSNFGCCEDDTINLRKEAMLRLNIDSKDDGEIVGERDYHEESSPIRFLRPSIRRNLNVISSDSEIDWSPTVMQAASEDEQFEIRNFDDISCVPQSFVAETVDENQAASSGTFEVSSCYEVTVEHKEMQAGVWKLCDIDFVNSEEQGDSQVNGAGTAIRLCTLMDECSRVDIIPSTIELGKAPRLTEAELVNAAWGRLRGREDIKSLVTPEQRVAYNVSKIVDGFANVISEADIMFSYCQPVICDHLEQSLLPYHEPELEGWYDKQYFKQSEMCSTFAQHGFCLYAKEAFVMEPNFDCQLKNAIAHEMLACSTSTMAMGKLISHEIEVSSSSGKEEEAPYIDFSSSSEEKEKLYNSILPVIPSRFQLAMRGGLHDYSSCLSQISRIENARLSQSVNGRQSRRSRTARHYLNSGSLNFTSEDVDLFSKHGCYKH